MNLPQTIRPIISAPKKKRRGRPQESDRPFCSQLKMSQETGIPPLFIRLLLDAGRLESHTLKSAPDARRVIRDSKKWNDALRAWQSLVQQHAGMSKRQADIEASLRAIDGMIKRAAEDNKRQEVFYHEMTGE